MKHVPIVLVLVLLCVAAALPGIRATRDLEWPPGQDFSRDIAIAETVANGHPLSDPFYRGEWAWYPPLVPSIAAGVAYALHQPIHLIYARSGAYLNLLAPLTLFVFMAVAFDRTTALAAVIGFLFCLPDNEPSWQRATYSPWLSPFEFVQSLTYIGLLSIYVAYRQRRARFWGLAGVCAGLVFLGDAGPALILSGIVVLLWIWSIGSAQRPSGLTLANVLFFPVGLVIAASPLWISVLGHYHLITVNRFPADFVEPSLSLENTAAFLRMMIIPTTGSLIASFGLIQLARDNKRTAARVVLAGGFATVLLLLYSYANQFGTRHGVLIPALVPGWHFVFYLRAFEAMAFGIGATAASDLLRNCRPAQSRCHAIGRWSTVLTIGILLGWAVTRYGGYTNRPDFTSERLASLRMFSDPELVAMRDWIVTSTVPSDVFIAPDNLSLSVVATAGRKVVAVDRFFSSPFVDWGRRARDRDRMTAALSAGREVDFIDLASVYRVRYVASNEALDGSCRCLRRVWSSTRWMIYEIRNS